MISTHRPRCDTCHLPMASHDQVEVRREYRSVAGLKRLRTWRMALVCRGCAMDEWSAHDFPRGRPNVEQGCLL